MWVFGALPNGKFSLNNNQVVQNQTHNENEDERLLVMATQSNFPKPWRESIRSWSKIITSLEIQLKALSRILNSFSFWFCFTFSLNEFPWYYNFTHLQHDGICALCIEKQVVRLTVPLWSVNRCPLGKSTTLGTVVLEWVMRQAFHDGWYSLPLTAMLQGILCFCVVEWKWDLIEPCIICCHIKVTLISFISLSLLHLQYLWVNISEEQTGASLLLLRAAVCL